MSKCCQILLSNKITSVHRILTPLAREWTMILPSAVRANRIPRGFSRVTRYSWRFILNDDDDDEEEEEEEELPDIAKTLTARVPALHRRK